MVVWALCVIGTFGLIAGGVRLGVYGWNRSALPDAEALGNSTGISLAFARKSDLATLVLATVIVCLGIGVLNALAKNPAAGPLSSLARKLSDGAANAVAWLAIVVAVLSGGESVFLAFQRPHDTGTLVLLAVGLAMLAVAALALLYRPRWGKKARLNSAANAAAPSLDRRPDENHSEVQP
jgi:hypothetical protein